MSTDVFSPKFTGLPTTPPADTAPVGKWGPDFLGPGFEGRTIELEPDAEGERVVTVVRHVPADDPDAIPGTPEGRRFIAIYVHGWNDYFFQREVARHFSGAAAAFYAIDLAKFGRSLRPHQSFGYVTDLAQWDDNFEAVIELARSEWPNLPIVLIGHSMGGLVTTLYAAKGPVDGLILNSPWLGQLSARATSIGAQLGRILPEAANSKVLPLSESELYARCLGPWPTDPLPATLAPWAEDPGLSGWPMIGEWKDPTGRETRVGWLTAIMDAHRQIQDGLRLQLPVYLGVSTSSPKQTATWRTEMRFQDVVLDVDTIVHAGAGISADLTIARFNAVHDITLSIPPVRTAWWLSVHRWLLAQGFAGRGVYDRLGDWGNGAICP